MVLHIILIKGYFVNSFLEKNQKIKEIHILNGILIIGCEFMNIDCIKGVGPSIIKKFEKIGINTIDELVSYYPFRYEIIKRSNIDELENDDKIIIDGVIETNPNVFYFNRRLDKMSSKLNTGKYLLNVVIFNRGFLKQTLKISTKVIIIGKYDKKHNTIVASEIRLGLIPEVPTIEPIYHSTSGLSSKQISTIIKKALKYDFNVVNYIPNRFLEKYKLLDKKNSIFKVHNPNNIYELKSALNTLKYEELFLFMIKMNSLKLSKRNKAETGIRYEWYALQRWGSNYSDDFNKQKIIYPNMTKYLPFYLDNNNFYVNQKCFIITGRHLGYLTAFLNSKLFKYCFRDSFPQLQGGTRELSKIFFEKIKIKMISDSLNEIFESKVIKLQSSIAEAKDTTAIELEIDEMILDLYNLTEKEKNQIMSFSIL